jgi:phosphatidylglycerophosphate synthase
MSWFSEYKKSLKMTEVEEFFDLFFYRPLAFFLVKIVYHTRITPNHLTLIAIFIGLISAAFYSIGPHYFIIAAICFALYNIVDCSDGMLARLKKNGSNAGRILDGLADYISTAAVLIGIAIGASRNTKDTAYWWLMLAAAGLSNVIQSALVDYYRNRFLDYVLQRTSTFEEGLQAFREEYAAIKNEKGKWLSRTIIRCYFIYSAIQSRLVAKKRKEKLFKASPEEYYKKNKAAVRLWVSIGPTSQVTALMVCTVLNRLDIFFWLMIGLYNVVAAIMWIVQLSIDKSFKKFRIDESSDTGSGNRIAVETVN